MGRQKGSRNKRHVPKVHCVCAQCGSTFERWPSQAVGQRGRYCSRGCASSATAATKEGAFKPGVDHPLWNGGSGSYRERAFREFGRQCQACGYDGYTELLWVHHKNFKPRAEQDDHSLENLEVLCIRCHLERHLEAGEGAKTVAIPV